LGRIFSPNSTSLSTSKKHFLRFGDAPPTGDRCRFQTSSQHHGSPTTNRLLIQVEFMGVSRNPVQLQLDTGAKTPELFPISHDAHPSMPWGGSIATSSGEHGAPSFRILRFELAGRWFPAGILFSLAVRLHSTQLACCREQYSAGSTSATRAGLWCSIPASEHWNCGREKCALCKLSFANARFLV